MSIKSGYKHTEIGVIPEDWKVIKLPEITVKITSGGTPSRVKPEYYENGTVNWIKTGELRDCYIYDSEEKITEEAVINSSAKKFPVDTLLIAMYGATIGRTAYLKVESSTNQACCAIIFNPEKANTHFYWQYFLFTKETLISRGCGAGQPNISQGIIKDLFIPFPPLEEQKKIADILSTVDKKIAFVEENISATEELKKGLMQKLLTEGIGHTEFKDSELGRIPESWEVKPFYNLASIKHGYAFKSESFSSIETDNVVLTPGNVKIGGGYNHKYFRFYDNTYFPEEYILKKNDLIISMTDLTPNSATLGYPFFVPEIENKKFLHNQRLGKVEINFLNIDKVFLFNFLCTDTYRNNIVSEATGTTVKHTSPTRILSQLIPIPPLEEQKQIAEILSTVDSKLENLKEKKQSFEELKKGLIQKLLTGEVRV